MRSTIIQVVVAAVFFVGCRSPATGRINGHAYLVTPSAEPRPAAGAEIYLLRREKVDTVVHEACRQVERIKDSLLAVGDRIDAQQPQLEETSRYVQLADEWHTHRAMHLAEALGALLRQRVEIARRIEEIAVDSARADIDGSYEIANLEAGSYQLFGEMVVEDKSYAWFIPVNLGKDEQRQQDLGNREEATRQVFCELDQLISVFEGFRYLEGVTRDLHEQWKRLAGYAP